MYLKRLALAVAGAAVATGMGAAPVISAEVTIRGASCFPIGSPPGRPFEALVKEVNKRGKGVVQIKMVGGAPAIGSPFTLTQKMSRGTYDVVGCTEAYFGNVLPEAPVLRMQEYSFAELRRRGAVAYVQKLFNRKGIHYVARHHDFGPFYLFLSKPIKSPNLTGLHLRVSPVYTAFFTSMGATVQRSNISQVYTYMENGTVQGFGWPALGWVPSWIKVSKYRVDPGVYHSSLHTMVNLRKWKSLTTEQQDVITQVGLEFEAKAETDTPGFVAAMKKQTDWSIKNGMKIITFTGADRAKWVGGANKAGWAEVAKRSPKHVGALRRLFTKGK
ncbi:MAG TPA: TRAP transporter substrate-binding protein DctP [Alphaproteobacteria bacterium]|nr:TRAP transporter substrate-binding protein DctP [Alphaproteobacteria bacterium]